jgi:hypothetical protein
VPLGYQNPFLCFEREFGEKECFQGGEAMSTLSFGVILVFLIFNIVVAFGLCLVKFSENVHQVSSRNDNVFKKLFQSFIAL